MAAPVEWVRRQSGPDGTEVLEAAFCRHKYERHIHETYAIGVTLSGVQRFWCRGATHDSLRGDVVAINPGEAHDGESGSDDGYRYRMIYLSIPQVRAIIADAIERPAPAVDGARPRISDRPLAMALDRAWQRLAGGASAATAQPLHDAVLALATRHAGITLPPVDHLARPALARVRQYLHATTDRDLAIDELAALAGLSRFQLTRQFKKAFGAPLRAYHLHLRLEEGKRRLRAGAPIAQVAIDLGFCDQSHFHRRFKGVYGMTPGAWSKA